MSESKKKPNIIIMYADDLGYGDVGCYGAEAIATPNIDRLAGSGLRFTNGYAAAATCTPSAMVLRNKPTSFLKTAASLRSAEI